MPLPPLLNWNIFLTWLGRAHASLLLCNPIRGTLSFISGQINHYYAKKSKICGTIETSRRLSTNYPHSSSEKNTVICVCTFIMRWCTGNAPSSTRTNNASFRSGLTRMHRRGGSQSRTHGRCSKSQLWRKWLLRINMFKSMSFSIPGWLKRLITSSAPLMLSRLLCKQPWMRSGGLRVWKPFFLWVDPSLPRMETLGRTCKLFNCVQWPSWL